MEKLITVLTATYNRRHLLTDLYESLCRQTCKDFEWLIIDDGSADGTGNLAKQWMSVNQGFSITYSYVLNGGKNRAINKGVKMIKTPFTMIVDSDDYLTDDAIEYLSLRLREVRDDEKIAGLSALRGISEDEPLQKVSFPIDTYVVANNLERKKHGLDCDACEVYRTSLLASHPFEVWEGEKFVPEEIVWNRIAEEGYPLRWYNRVTYIARYQDTGLTKDSFNLIKNNPMGYAMLYKERIKRCAKREERIYNNIQLIAYSILGGHLLFAFDNNINAYSILAFPLGVIISVRRKIQYKSLLKKK